MNRIRGSLLAVLIATGGVLVPAEKSEAGLIDWLRCALNPCRWPCDACGNTIGGCPDGSCAPPVVQEGNYCNPCQTCTTCYVRRSYMEPRTCMVKKTALEACPTYVRRSYWDPCSVCYKTVLEPSTSYVRRSYYVPVTNYVERSYLEPVTTCTTPSCPTSTCPTSCVTPPADSSPTSVPDQQGRRNQPVARGPASPSVPSRSALTPSSTPNRSGVRSTEPSAALPIPLAASFERSATF